MAPVRRLMRELEAVDAGCGGGTGGARGAAESALRARQAHQQPVEIKVGPIEAADIEGALLVTRPSAQRYHKQYTEWNERYGSH